MLRKSKENEPRKPTKTFQQGNLKKDLKYSNNLVQAKLDMTTFQTMRYDINFLLPLELKGTEDLQSYFSEIFQTFQGYCEKLKLMPWNDEKIK